MVTELAESGAGDVVIRSIAGHDSRAGRQLDRRPRRRQHHHADHPAADRQLFFRGQCTFYVWAKVASGGAGGGGGPTATILAQAAGSFPIPPSCEQQATRRISGRIRKGDGPTQVRRNIQFSEHPPVCQRHAKIRRRSSWSLAAPSRARRVPSGPGSPSGRASRRWSKPLGQAPPQGMMPQSSSILSLWYSRSITEENNVFSPLDAAQ